MLTYSIDGHILTLTADGRSTPEERAATFGAIRADPGIPSGCSLLLDLRGLTEPFDYGAVQTRLARILDGMGPKLGDVCAVIAPESHVVESHLFQSIASGAGVRVGLFHEETAARAWLSAYASPPV